MTAEEKVREVELALDGVNLRETVRGSIISDWREFRTPWHWCENCEAEQYFYVGELHKLQKLFGETGFHAVFGDEIERLSAKVLAFDPGSFSSVPQWNLFLQWLELKGIRRTAAQEVQWREVENQRRKMFPEPEKTETKK